MDGDPRSCQDGAEREHAYLEVQVMTATPQRLRLMLIEGAIRWARQAIRCLEEAKAEDACEAIIRCRGIVTELLSAVKSDESELARQVAGVYLFLFRTLTEVQFRRDRREMENVLNVLGEERETWRRVCEQMPEAPDPMVGERDKSKEITACGLAAISPTAPPAGALYDLAASARRDRRDRTLCRSKRSWTASLWGAGSPPVVLRKQVEPSRRPPAGRTPRRDRLRPGLLGWNRKNRTRRRAVTPHRRRRSLHHTDFSRRWPPETWRRRGPPSILEGKWRDGARRFDDSLGLKEAAMHKNRLLPIWIALAAMLAAAPWAPGKASGQETPKKALDHDAYDIWKQIKSSSISRDGQWAWYTLQPGKGDAELKIRQLHGAKEYTAVRGASARCDYSGKFAVYLVQPAPEAVKTARRAKKKSEEIPQASLVILELGSGKSISIPRVKSFAIPEKAGGWAACLLEKPEPPPELKTDRVSTKTGPESTLSEERAKAPQTNPTEAKTPQPAAVGKPASGGARRGSTTAEREEERRRHGVGAAPSGVGRRVPLSGRDVLCILQGRQAFGLGGVGGTAGRGRRLRGDAPKCASAASRRRSGTLPEPDV